MNFNYAGSRKTADRLITKFGQSATLRQTSTTGGDPWDPGSGTTTTTETTVIVAIVDWANNQIDGTLIRSTDRHVLMSAQGLGVTPALGDQLIVGGETLSLVEPLKQINPGGTVVVYDMNARA